MYLKMQFKNKHIVLLLIFSIFVLKILRGLYND